MIVVASVMLIVALATIFLFFNVVAKNLNYYSCHTVA